MKYLFYFYSNFNPLFMGMLLDEAIELAKDKQNDVRFVYCGGICEMCLFNRKGSKSLCRFCSYITRRILNNYGIKNEPLSKYISNSKIKLNYDNSDELRALKYRGVNIGLAVMSSYISGCRNLYPKINNESRCFFDAHINQMVRMVDAFYNLINQFKPDYCYTFNGRFEEVRPVYDICKNEKIHFFLSEGIPDNGRWRKLMFENHLPHNIQYNKERWDYCWDHYEMSEEEKIELGKSFFEKRRNGVYAGDRIYIKDQVKGKIPPIDDNKINIAIMNSSEDEYSSVGEEWDEMKVFPTQYDGIVYLLENANENIHFYLRVHPNLKDVTYKYHTKLLELESIYSNVTVIPGNSDVSTYDLMDKMDKIIVFGSTMGMESVYWGKPVILLGAAIYSYENICYIPQSPVELIGLLHKKLEPLYNDSIIRIGAFSLNEDPLFIKDKNIDYQICRRHIGKLKYSIVPYIKFLGGKYLSGLFTAVGRFILGARLFNRFKYPLEEA